MRVGGRVIRFSDWAPPRFVKSLSERPYRPDNTAQKVYVAYHDKDFTVMLRCWTVCEGVEPELRQEKVAFHSYDETKRFLEKHHPGLTQIEPTPNDPVRVMATWV